MEEFGGVEPELGLDVDRVVGLEGVSVNAVRSLVFGTESDRGAGEELGSDWSKGEGGERKGGTD